jgi:hypothetical protein
MTGLPTGILRPSSELRACVRRVARTSSSALVQWTSVPAVVLHTIVPRARRVLRVAPSTATHVAGFHAWRPLGRFVRKGEKGIAILAPITAC